MLPLSTRLKDALNNDVELRAYPKLVAEWNYNRYAGIDKVDATPSEEKENKDLDPFPVASIVEPNRPTRGIIKGRTAPPNTSWRTLPKGEEGFVVAGYTDRPADQRYYTASSDSLYKYWSSTLPSSKIKNTNNTYGMASVQTVYVTYKTISQANKIVVGFESFWAKPVNFRVQVQSTGTLWSTVLPTLR